MDTCSHGTGLPTGVRDAPVHKTKTWLQGNMVHPNSPLIHIHLLLGHLSSLGLFLEGVQNSARTKIHNGSI